MVNVYENQRSMRKMRKQAMQRGYLAALDIGTSKIACFIIKFDEYGRRYNSDEVGSMAGQSDFQIIGSAMIKSRGVSFGEITAMQETERAIRAVVQSAQRVANQRVDHVVACMSGAHPSSHDFDGFIDLHSNVVKESDVARVLSSCKIPFLGTGREVMHAQPINFTLDNRSGLRDPRGQMGNSLAVDMHMVSVDALAIRNLINCVHRCDLELAGIVYSAYGSALSTLVEDEQELGAACVDMGGGTTGISIFMRKHMIHAESVRMGGDHITGDISMGLQIPPKNAESLKTLHGGVLATSADDNEYLDLKSKTGDWEYDQRQFSRSELIGIMRPRVEEILEEVRDRLRAVGFDEIGPQKVVLTGGTSQVPGIVDLAARILDCQVRLGRPVRLAGLTEQTSGPSFASLVGLSQIATHPQDEYWDFDLPEHGGRANSLKKFGRWIMENW